MATTPTTEPTSIPAGDTARWLKSLADHPASAGWQLTYTLVNSTSRIVINAEANGNDHLVNVSPATSAGWAPGAYDWRATVAQAGDVFTVAAGRITIAPSFDTPQDGRSPARQALESVEAYLADPAHLAAAEYQIAGRQLRRHSIADLWRHRDRLRIEVTREENAARRATGRGPAGRIQVRYG